MIKILSTEKQKRKVRVHFACGGRLLQQLQRKHEELSAASKLLSTPEDSISNAIEKLLASNRALEKSLEHAKEELLSFEAKSLVENKNGRVIKDSFSDRSVQELQKLARLIVAEDESIIALLVAENEDRIQFVAARGTLSEASMKQVAASVLPLLNGKGGGSDSFVQGGGERSMSVEELLNVMENTIVK